MTGWLEGMVTVWVLRDQLSQGKAKSHWLRKTHLFVPSLSGTSYVYFIVGNIHIGLWHTHIINWSDKVHYYARSTSPNNLPAEQRLSAPRLQSAFSFVLLSSPFFFAIHQLPPSPPSPALISQGKAPPNITFPSNPSKLNLSKRLKGDGGGGGEWGGRDEGVRGVGVWEVEGWQLGDTP